MGIETWNNIPDQSEAEATRKERKRQEKKQKRVEKPKKDEPDLSRRKALKVIGVSAVALAGGKALSDLFDTNDKDNEETIPANESIEVENQVERELSREEEIAAEFLRVYETLAIGRRYDPEVFTDDFFMAQQFQESRGKKEAESGMGAKGVYQMMPDATSYVADYLTDMTKRTKDLPVGQRVEYNGPAKIDETEASKIGDWYKEHVNYGRAAGKLYLLAIHDSDSKYNRGGTDVFRGKSVKEQQKLLLLSYQSGPSIRTHPETAKTEGRKYVKFVFENMETIADLRNRLKKAGMDRKLNYAIQFILEKLDDGENKNSKENPTARDDAINYWIKKLQDAHMEKWQRTGDADEKISNEEIWEIFN